MSKSFEKNGRRIFPIKDFNISVEPGEFLVLLGRSGCGKSTLLNMMSGLTSPSSGEIVFEGRPVTAPRTEIGYLTQQDALMPWRTVRRNVQLPLELKGLSDEDCERRTLELIGQVGLGGFEDHYPHQLSGGMRRRCGLARMLCSDPRVLLLDEPFGALDAQLRQQLQQDLLALWQGTGRTVIFVTHDLDEALCLGDRIVVLGAGGRIILDERVGLSRPRDLSTIRLDPEFVQAHQKLNSALKA